MANPYRDEMGIQVEGEQYTFRPDYNAMCALEDITNGKTFIDAANEMAAGFPNSGLRRVVWTLLQPLHANEIKTLNDAGHWIVRAGGADTVFPIVSALFERIQNNAKDDTSPTTNPPEAQVVGTGAH